MEIKDLLSDGRKIESIWFSDESNYTVGKSDIVNIECYPEKGEMTHIPWFAIFLLGYNEPIFKVNSKFVVEIRYRKYPE